MTPKSQSFCRLSQSYTEVLYEVLYEYPQKDIWDEITQGQAIKDMLLQYEETDWEFLKRLASHFSTFLVADSSADCGRAYFGIPNINYGTDLLLEEYQISRSQNKYDKISKESIRFSVIKKSRYIHCSEFDSFLLYQIAINFLIISL